MDFKLIVGILGNVIAVLLFASPMPTFWKIYKNKSTQDFDGLPYVCALFNCFLWVLYGLPIVTDNALLVVTINGIGCAFEILYIFLYLTYAPRKNRLNANIQATGACKTSLQIKTLKVLLSCLALYGVILVITLAVLKKKSRKLEVGTLCVILNILMYASPLSVMKLVITTRSVEFMPLPLSICVFVNSSVWMGYGVFAKDIFIMVPNGLGMLSGFAQLALYAIYKNATPRSSSPMSKQLKPTNSMQSEGTTKDTTTKAKLVCTKCPEKLSTNVDVDDGVYI